MALDELKLVIPDELNEKYSGALSELKAGSGTLIGYKEQLAQLRVALNDPETPNAMLLGEQGIGKTAVVEELLHVSADSDKPLLAVTLAIETLGQLNENIMVARMRTLLSDMHLVEVETRKANPNRDFTVALFIDEVHKLHGYGLSGDTSGAMNALKEGSARGEFPIITATTDYEYRKNIVTDPAFDRRFHKVIMQQPTREQTIKILERRLTSWQAQGKDVPEMEQGFLDELTILTDGYIRNQVNPAKSLAILSGTVAYGSMYKKPLNHEALRFVFSSEGYNIDSLASAKHVRDVVSRRVKGQPLALKYISDAINISFYTQRNRKKPLMTIFAGGTTGVGKSETAKALAEAFFGREDALLTINGGDYSTENDAQKAQSFIGDAVSVNKQQLILLDEIEKSHSNVLMSYMRMIDEGIVRDSLGIERSINNTIVMATSNLGAKVFEELKDVMNLDTQPEPDVLSAGLVEAWQSMDSSVRKALRAGDDGLNNGIRPEFLERFSLFIPYLPLTKITYSRIARAKLMSFKNSMQQNGYLIAMPEKTSVKEWRRLFGNKYINYDDVDTISVMIAEDIMSPEASALGARAIGRFIDTEVKSAVANKIADIESQGLDPKEYVYRVTTNGHAVFESPDKTSANVDVQVKSKAQLRREKLQKASNI